MQLKPFGNKGNTAILIAIFVVVFFFAASKCSAESVLNAEVGATAIRAPAAAMGVNITWPGAGPRDADFQCGLYLIAQYEYGGKGQPNQAVADCLVINHIKRFSIGLGPAFLQNTDAINGSHFNFALMIGYRVTPRLSVAWRHFSNAGTKQPNKGRDAVMVNWAF